MPGGEGVLSKDPVSGQRSLSWWGHAGNTYFVLRSPDLIAWSYAPVIEPGTDTLLEWSLASGTPRTFVRLRYSDLPTSDPEGDDFDLDGVSNIDEVREGTDPLAFEDSDLDGLPDDWEQLYGLDPQNPADASSDIDDDGLTAAIEFGFRSNPTRRDSDRDGLSDTFEALAGTLANSSTDAPFEARAHTGLLVYAPAAPPFGATP